MNFHISIYVKTNQTFLIIRKSYRAVELIIHLQHACASRCLKNKDPISVDYYCFSIANRVSAVRCLLKYSFKLEIN